MLLKFIFILTISSISVLGSKGKKPDCTKITCGAQCQGSCGWSSFKNKCLYGYTTSIFEYNRGPGCKHKLTETSTSLTSLTTTTSSSSSSVSESTTTSFTSLTSSTSSNSATTISTTSFVSSTSSISESTTTSSSDSILPPSLPFLETTTISNVYKNMTRNTELNLNNSKTTVSSILKETNTTQIPERNLNKPDNIEKSHSTHKNNQIKTIIPITTCIVLIIGVGILIKKKNKKVYHRTNSPNEASNSPVSDTSPFPNESEYLEPTPLTEQIRNINELNLYAEIEDRLPNDGIALNNDYEYGNLDILASFDSNYQETEFQSEGFDYARASSTTQTVNYQLANNNHNLASGVSQDPRYEVAD